jgi:hypothetical protein
MMTRERNFKRKRCEILEDLSWSREGFSREKRRIFEGQELVTGRIFEGKEVDF